MQLVDTLFPDLAPNATTRVYFGLGESQDVKIGITSRRSGRRGGEMHFTELCSVPGGRSIEAEYHDKYAVERIGRTEWFRLSSRLLLDLMNMCARQERVQSYEVLKAIMLRRLEQVAA